MESIEFESGGEPRQYGRPERKIEGVSAAIDALAAGETPAGLPDAREPWADSADRRTAFCDDPATVARAAVADHF